MTRSSEVSELSSPFPKMLEADSLLVILECCQSLEAVVSSHGV